MKKLQKIIVLLTVFMLVGLTITPVKSTQAAKTALSAKKKALYVGDSFTLSLNNAKGKITWKSSDKKVATVKNGVVTAVGEGKAKITAKNKSKIKR